MNKGSSEYEKVMNGLGKIPGLNLPIPGLSKAGYKPGSGSQRASEPPAFSPSIMESQPQERTKTLTEAKFPLSKNDKEIFLQTLKVFFDNHASRETSLSESKEVFSTLESIAERNKGNQYLYRALTHLIEAARDFDLSRGHLRMVIKNTAEYIKSM